MNYSIEVKDRDGQDKGLRFFCNDGNNPNVDIIFDKNGDCSMMKISDEDMTRIIDFVSDILGRK
jgi:hypothetical protein